MPVLSPPNPPLLKTCSLRQAVLWLAFDDLPPVPPEWEVLQEPPDRLDRDQSPVREAWRSLYAAFLTKLPLYGCEAEIAWIDTGAPVPDWLQEERDKHAFVEVDGVMVCGLSAPKRVPVAFVRNARLADFDLDGSRILYPINPVQPGAVVLWTDLEIKVADLLELCSEGGTASDGHAVEFFQTRMFGLLVELTRRMRAAPDREWVKKVIEHQLELIDPGISENDRATVAAMVLPDEVRGKTATRRGR